MNKNNTNYPNELKKKIKDDLLIIKNKLNNQLFDYQRLVYNYLIERENRGLLIFHGLGSGKTLSAVSVAEYFRKSNREIMILAPKSLHNNFKNNIKKYNKNITDDEIENSYKFITSNASNMIKQLDTTEKLDLQLNEINKINIDNKVIIIDEAHMLGNSIVNGSKNANEFYDLIMNAKNIKIILLTATPIVNNAFELSPLLNMCNGKIYKRSTELIITKTKDYYTILPEYYQDFMKLFVNEENNTIKNAEYFQNRIFGLVSYNGELFIEKKDEFKVELKETKKRDNFPDRLPIKIIKINMSLQQNIEYSKYRDKERYEASRSYKGGAIFKDKFSTSSSYRIRSRQISNVYLIENQEFDIKKLDIYSPKMKKMYEIIKNCHKNQLGVIYSTFLQAGLEYMSQILDHYNYESFNDILDINTDHTQIQPKLRYAMFTGKINIDIRNYIINIYNSPENKNGELIHLLLISSTGEKGINLKRVRHVHIMEPQWSYTTLEQVIGRAVRYNSHKDLPLNQQNVQVYMYISDYNIEFLEKEKEKKAKQKNDKKKQPIEDTTDKTLLYRSIRNKELNDKFLKLLAETSIDCYEFNKGYNFNCYSCNPTNETLYYPDINIDVNTPNKCINPNKSILAEEVIINGDIYYYTKDKENITVYKKNKNDDIFNEITDKKIINTIKKNLKIN